MAILKEGKHDVEVVATALSEEAGKADTILVQFVDEHGDGITAYLFCSEKAWPYTEEKLQTLGWDAMARGYRFEELNDDPSPLLGHKAQIVVEAETFEGKTRSKVRFINRAGGHIERMAPSEANTFAKRLRDRILKGTVTSTNTAPTKPRAAAPADTDDIPF